MADLLLSIALLALAASLVLPLGLPARAAYFLAALSAAALIFSRGGDAPLAGGAFWPALAALILAGAAWSASEVRLGSLPALALLGALQVACCISLADLAANWGFVPRVLATFGGFALPWLAALRLFQVRTLLPAMCLSAFLVYVALAGAEPLCPFGGEAFCLVPMTARVALPEIWVFACAALVAWRHGAWRIDNHREPATV